MSLSGVQEYTGHYQMLLIAVSSKVIIYLKEARLVRLCVYKVRLNFYWLPMQQIPTFSELFNIEDCETSWKAQMSTFHLKAMVTRYTY